jgi:hypothetical protein
VARPSGGCPFKIRQRPNEQQESARRRPAAPRSPAFRPGADALLVEHKNGDTVDATFHVDPFALGHLRAGGSSSASSDRAGDVGVEARALSSYRAVAHPRGQGPGTPGPAARPPRSLPTGGRAQWPLTRRLVSFTLRRSGAGEFSQPGGGPVEIRRAR